MKLKRITALILVCFMLFTVAMAEETEINTGSLFSQQTQEQPVSTDVVPEEAASEQQEQTTEPQQEKSYFSDVPVDSPYAEAVTKMVESGIINGYGDNTFRPENGVTRAEMCKMINLTFNYIDYDKAQGFPDVTENDWFAPYALAAQQNGYVEGYEDGTFRGNNNITRQEVCMIINRIVKPMDLREFGIKAVITDTVADWARDSVELVVINNFMPLEENGTFRATENIKRYELASLLSLFVMPPAEPLTAVVRFFDENGTQIGEDDTVFIGDYPTVPEAPKHKDEAYEFAGWREVGATELIDAKNHMILGDTDYEAVYRIKTYKVEFYDGGTLLETVTVEHGKSPKKPANDPVTPGYDFKGWSYHDGGITVDVNSLIIVTDTELYAVFEKSLLPDVGGGDDGSDDDEDDGGDVGGTEETVYYNVFFYVNEEIYDTQSVLKGASPKLPKEPELENAVFLGWSLDEEGDEGDLIKVTSYKVKDHTDIYAVIKKNPNDPELIEMLERGIEQLYDIALTKNVHKTARTEIIACMELVLNDAKNGIYVDKAYVGETYSEEIAYVESLVLDEMSARDASEFKTLLTNNVDKDVRDFLSEYFLNGEDIEI